MNRITKCIVVLLPLALASGACSKQEANRIAAPDPSGTVAPVVAQAHWVWDRDALNAAVSQAATSPLVQSALSEAPVAGLTPRFELAVRVAATAGDGSSYFVTFLPYQFGNDSTHAMIVSLIEGLGVRMAEPAEVILGRAPTSLESGFTPYAWGDRTIWVKSGASWAVKAGGIALAPEKRRWVQFFDCLTTRMPAGCAAGAVIGATIGGPAAPYGAAIGCGVGAAVGAAACALDIL
jgi:hypothetical protein